MVYQKNLENGWSHSALIHQIESGLYERQETAEKVSNFETRLASPQSELAVQTQMQDRLDEYEAENRLPDKALDDFYEKMKQDVMSFVYSLEAEAE